MEKGGWVYILASGYNGTLYIGVTSNIAKRMYEHRHNCADGFTKKYKVHDLVYCEFHDTIEGAILREKQMKEWKREWKINLIKKENPDWNDLYDRVML